jgi:hypothetical protein
MITIEQYAGAWVTHKDWTPQVRSNAKRLLESVNKLKALAEADGVVFKINPQTKSNISGVTLGGFRPQNATQGAPKSNHKQGLAIDIFDPDNKIDGWCMANLNQLEACGIWIEHPSATPTWSHWQCVAPKSNNRVFYP